jgi:predicted Zn-dependent protease
MKKIFLLINILCMSMFLSGCSSLEPDQEQINEMALQAYNEVKANTKISDNAEWRAMVDRVARRITEESDEDFDWEWMLIESPEINAWCMPGGKIAVYTGIMPVLQTEAALAAVLGHEVAHATLNHGKERYARAIKGNLAGAVIGGVAAVGGQALCRTETCRLLTGIGGAAAGFAITFFDRKFSREDEVEADKAGQRYMAKAGYKPEEAVEVWQRMKEAGGGVEPPEILSTHPSSKTRIENLKGWLPGAREIYSEAPQKHGMGERIQ